MNQINCIELKSYTNWDALLHTRPIPIDCKWYKTLLYLYRRNISIVIEKPTKCSLDHFLSANKMSMHIMSKCFSNDLFQLTEVAEKESSVDKNNSSSSLNVDSTLFEIDANNKYEFRLDPSLNQILIEGDALELTCRLKKLDTAGHLNANFQRLKMSLFYKSQLKWYVNETQLLAGERLQIVENKAKLKNSDFLIESKLIVASTAKVKHSGRFRCVASLYVDSSRHATLLNSTRVEIQVLGKNELTEFDQRMATRQQNKAPEIRPEPVKLRPYCPELITQTYKGIKNLRL